MSSTPTYADLETEGCNIHYWYHGSGPLLVFVPGGNGHGRQCKCSFVLSSCPPFIQLTTNHLFDNSITNAIKLPT